MKKYESWIDPANGVWIRMLEGEFQGVVWRPVDMKMADEANEDESLNMSFNCEFFGEVPENVEKFEPVAGEVLLEVLTEIAELDTNNGS